MASDCETIPVTDQYLELLYQQNKAVPRKSHRITLKTHTETHYQYEISMISESH